MGFLLLEGNRNETSESGPMQSLPILRRYEGSQLREIALPLGGIGTGSFCLGGRGQLTDWQLMSRPNRGWRPMYAHLLVRTRQGSDVKLRVLEGDLVEGAAGDSGLRETFAGVPRFRRATFEAAYPYGRVLLSDDHTPFDATLEGFNPLVPEDVNASSLPMALMTITVSNKTDEPLESTVAFVGSNVIGCDGIGCDLKDNITEFASAHGWHGMAWSKSREAKDPRFGTMAVLCDAVNVDVARTWAFRDRGWNGEILGLIDALHDDGTILDPSPETPCGPSPSDTWDSSVCGRVHVPARGSATVRFLVTWCFPWREASLGWTWSGPKGESVVRNHYSTQFEDALDVADRVIPQLATLRERTGAFVQSVIDRDAPLSMREAALFNLASLRSPTCFRLDDGKFFGFEGCNGQSGCCEGNCAHVWNYEEATVALFPELHRSMIETFLNDGLTDSGGLKFRINLPIANQTFPLAAADGQMGVVVRTYQQYLRDGDIEWLHRVFAKVKKAIEFAWMPGGWDADKDGVMEGAQHNTYDVEFFGPNPMCTVWYLAALRSAARMADLVGDVAFASTCSELADRGGKWVDEHLFNGSFYTQTETAPHTTPHPMTTSGYKPGTFQVGSGCLIDQLVGQYKANRVGLGDLLDRFHIGKTMQSVFKFNHQTHFRDHYNNMRTYAYADERGTLICSYPYGGRPEIPFPYWGECMTGFEYQFAVCLLDYGYREEAEAVVAAVRDRHSGHNRNPFNEPECGSYYARAMASWALLDAWDRGPRAPAVGRGD